MRTITGYFVFWLAFASVFCSFPFNAEAGDVIINGMSFGPTYYGSFEKSFASAGLDDAEMTSISFPGVLETAPIAQWIPLAGPTTAYCTGTAVSPTAAKGYLCLYESVSSNIGGRLIATASSYTLGTDKTGVILYISAAAAGPTRVIGRWALTP